LEARYAPLNVPDPVQPGLALATTVADQLLVAAQRGPDESGFTPGGVILKKSHSTPVCRTMIAIDGSGSDRRPGTAPAGIGARTRRALQVGKLIWTVTSGVDLDATQTDGTETIVGPRHFASTHHLLLNEFMRLSLLGAIGGFLGIGVFQALAERYHRPSTHPGRVRLEARFMHRRCLEPARPAQLAPKDLQSSFCIESAALGRAHEPTRGATVRLAAAVP
jgi:hypothetical protein